MNASQRRKQNREFMRRSHAESLPDGCWRLDNNSPLFMNPPREPDVPGVNCPPVSEEFDGKVSRNVWHEPTEFDAFIKVIKRLSGNEHHDDDRWSWAMNTDCKYVDFRIDMRDGGFIMMNRDGKRINLEQLMWQYRSARTTP